MISKEEVIGRLRNLPFKHDGKDVIESGVISGVVVREDRVGISIEAGKISSSETETLKQLAERTVRQVKGVNSVTTVLTSQREDGEKPEQMKKPANWDHAPVEGIKNIIAVASGKGGVGKSTVAVNLAAALAAKGLKVGIMDADIYGPSLHRMMNLSGKPEVKNGQIIPMESHGIKCISMGSLTAEDQPIVWRGPMLAKTLNQFVRSVDWGKLDYLIVDMPPGTGDIHISMIQQVPLSGVIIVSTPQEIALIDARRCLNMFRQLGVAVLGIVENMSYFIDPASGNKTHIFGDGGARKMATELNVPFLGEVPINQEIGANSDAGRLSITPEFSQIAEKFAKS